jgi:hypothetical protein
MSNLLILSWKKPLLRNLRLLKRIYENPVGGCDTQAFRAHSTLVYWHVGKDV